MIKIRKQKTKNGYALYLDCYFEGNRKWFHTGLFLTGDKIGDSSVMKKAEILAAKKLLEITSRPFSTINNSFTQFAEKVCSENPAYIRQTNIIKNLNKFQPEIKFTDLSPSWWDNFHKYLKARGYATTTIYLFFKVIKTIINKAVSEDIILKNPLLSVRMKKGSTVKYYLTIEEMKLLYHTPCLKPVIKDAFFFSCYTGLRLGDIEKLTQENIRESLLTIKQSKTREYITIPLSPQAREFIRTDNNKVFGLPSRSVISNVLRSWVLASGITKPITFHSSRHTFATLSLTYDVPIEVISELLGHSDLSTTKVYAKIISEKKTEAVNKLPSLH